MEYPSIKELADYIEKELMEDKNQEEEKESINNQTNKETTHQIREENQLPEKHRKLYNNNISLEYEPVAIIGMAARFPQSSNIENFWDNIKNGNLLVEEVPYDRFDIRPFLTEKQGIPGFTYSKWAGLLNDNVL